MGRAVIIEHGGHIVLSVLARARRAQYTYPLLLLCVGGIGFVLRLYRLDAQSLRGDEILGMLAVRSSYADMFASEALVDHPPLYFFILRLWIAVAGQSDFAVRFLSVAFSTLTVLLVYHVGRRLIAPKVGCLAAVIAAASPFSVAYGQEARAYALAFLFATASAYLTIRLVERGDLGSWALWSAVSLLALFSEYMTIQVVAFGELYVFVVLRVRRPCPWRYWLLAQAIILVPFILWLYFSQAVTNVYAYDSAAWGFDLIDSLRQTAMAFSVGNPLADQAAVLWTVLLVCLAALGLLHSRRHLPRLLFLSSYLCLPIVITYVVSLGKLGFSPRHLLFAIPAFFLLIASGLVWLRQRSWLFFAPGLALVLAVSGAYLISYYYDSSYGREDLRSMAQYVTDRARPSDLVVFTSRWGERMFRYYSDTPLKTVGLPEPDQRDPQKIESRLREVTTGHDRVWLVLYDSFATDPHAIIGNWFGNNSYSLGDKSFQGVWIRSFLTKSPLLDNRPVAQHPADMLFGQKMHLVGYDVDDVEAPTKGRIDLTLYWQGLQSMQESYRVQVRLIDEQQRVWAIRDHRPVADTLPTSRWTPGRYVSDEYELRVLAGTPPGRYKVVVQVYDAADGRALTMERGVGQSVLGVVEVPRRVVPPSLDRHDVQVQSQQTVGGIELLGYSVWGMGDQRGTRLGVRGGDELTVSTVWRASHNSGPVIGLSLQLEGQGRTIRMPRSPVGGRYPSDLWQAGEVVREFRTLPIDPELPVGTYRFTAELDERVRIALGVVDVKSSERVYSPGTGSYKVERTFGGLITLLGYDMKPTSSVALKPGDTLDLRLYWTAEKKVGKRYTAFTHLVDSAENIVGQHDAEPGEGAYLTTGWLPGDTVPDPHGIVVGPNVAPDIYRLFVGLYDARTGERLSLADGGNRLLLREVRIGASVD